MVQDMLKNIHGISERENSRQPEMDLISSVDAALELWTALRDDSCRLEINFEPELKSKIPRTLPSFEASPTSGSKIPETIDLPPSFALFSRVGILRDDGKDTTAGVRVNGNSGGGGPRVILAKEPVVVPQG